MDERLERVVGLLESWAEGQLNPRAPGVGICSNLGLELPDSGLTSEELVARAAESWPEFSGDLKFPIRHEYVSPESAYTAVCQVPKWGDDSYGQARRRLCQHVADWIRANPETAAELLWE